MVEAFFMSDEDGRFSIEGVPVGDVWIGFSMYSPRLDKGRGLVVPVREGQTTEAQLFGRLQNRRLPVEFLIGDGSKEQSESGVGFDPKHAENSVNEPTPAFEVSLIPISGAAPLPPINCRNEQIDSGDQIVLPDVIPGSYHLEVSESPGGGGGPGRYLVEQRHHCTR